LLNVVLGYLNQVTTPLTFIPMMSQAFAMLNISLNRIRDFLIVPELKITIEKLDDNETKQKETPENIVIKIKKGRFKWGLPPEIPMSETEMQQTKLEKMRCEKEGRKKEKEKLNYNKSQSIFKNIDSTVNQIKPNSNVGINITNVSVRQQATKTEIETETETDVDEINSIPTSYPISLPSPSTTPSLSPFSSASPSLDKNRPTLNNINVKIMKGELIMIIGLFCFIYLNFCIRRSWKWKI
jgi:ABC-type multidrug transport system fused ATPase/permease subunit